METIYHIPAMLEETLQGLLTNKDGVYVDVTLGGGGHSRAILERLGSNGRLYSFDQDREAILNALEDKGLRMWDEGHETTAGEDAPINRHASIGIAGFCPLCAVVEGVGGEEKEDVEEESDAAGEGLVLAEEKDRGRSREKEEIEKHQQGLLSGTITVNADGCRYAEDIVEDHKGGIQHR